MADPKTANFDTAAARRSLAVRLDAFRRRARLHVGVAGAVRVVLLTATLAMASFMVDRIFRLGVGTRVVLLLLGLAYIGIELWRFVLSPLRRHVGYVQLADAIDRAGPAHTAALAPRVATVLQLESQAADRVPPSAAMVRDAVERASRSLEHEQFDSRLDEGAWQAHLLTVAAVLSGLVMFAAIYPGVTGLWLKRWLLASSQPWPQKTYLAVSGLTPDGKLLVPRGESATLFVRVKDDSVEPQEIELRLRPEGGKRIDAVMSRFAAGDFRHDLPLVQAPLTFEAEGGDDEIGPFRVEPVDRPRVEKLQLFVKHPTDPAEKAFGFDSESAEPTFLPQTAMRLVVRGSTPLDRITLGDDASVKRLDDRSFEASWTHTKAKNFKIELTAAATGLQSPPTPLSVGLLSDTPPRVSLAYSGLRQRITPQATIPLTAQARDDFGVHALKLAAHAEWLDPGDQKKHAKDTAADLFGPQHPAVEKDVQLSNTFAVASLSAPVGALVSLSAVADDERYEGAQTGKSKEATFRLVQPEELFREILLRQQGERAKFRKAVDEATAIKNELPAATDPAALARRHRVVAREAARIGTSLAESLTEMRLNALGTQEAQELMQRSVLAPLKELNDGLMVEQRDALDALRPSADTAAAAERQGRIVDAMNAVLKQMAQWDSFVDVINQLNEIIRLQEKAKLTTEQLRKKEADSVFDK